MLSYETLHGFCQFRSTLPLGPQFDNAHHSSAVGTATRYGLDGPGIESPWGGGRDFSAPVHTGPGAHPAPCTMGTGSFPGDKAAGAWC